MRSTRLEFPFHRARVIKRALGIMRKYVVALTHCSCTILRGRIPSELLSFQLLADGPRKVAIGTSRLYRLCQNERTLIASQVTWYPHARLSAVLMRGT